MGSKYATKLEDFGVDACYCVEVWSNGRGQNGILLAKRTPRIELGHLPAFRFMGGVCHWISPPNPPKKFLQGVFGPCHLFSLVPIHHCVELAGANMEGQPKVQG